MLMSEQVTFFITRSGQDSILKKCYHLLENNNTENNLVSTNEGRKRTK